LNINKFLKKKEIASDQNNFYSHMPLSIEKLNPDSQNYFIEQDETEKPFLIDKNV